jgi:hypothetical protein
MSLISSIDKFTPNPLPSLPPTPTSEEDLSRRWAWQEGGESDNLQSRKSEERQLQEQYADASDEASEHTDAGVYPPVNDDEAETRRVEEVRMAHSAQCIDIDIFCLIQLSES